MSSSSQQLFRKSVKFYDKHYLLVDHRVLQGSNKVYLGDRESKLCRFCGKSYPDVTFRNRAHAVTECLGNKILFSYYECDECNQTFGTGIEDHLCKFLATKRYVSGIKGKHGVPTLRSSRFKGWEATSDGKNSVICCGDGEELITFDEPNKRVLITFESQSYIPAAVYKGFSKIALSLVPEAMVYLFLPTLEWLRSPVDSQENIIDPLYLFETFIPGPPFFKNVETYLLRRKEKEAVVPFMFFVICIGNFMFQLMIPSTEDYKNYSKGMRMLVFPNAVDMIESPFGESITRTVDLSSTCMVRNETRNVSLRYSNLVKS